MELHQTGVDAIHDVCVEAGDIVTLGAEVRGCCELSCRGNHRDGRSGLRDIKSKGFRRFTAENHHLMLADLDSGAGL